MENRKFICIYFRALETLGWRSRLNDDFYNTLRVTAVTAKKRQNKDINTQDQAAKTAKSSSRKKSAEIDDITVPPNIDPKWEKYYKRLVRLRNRLLEQQRALAQASTAESEPYGMHMADTGTDNFERDVALSLLSSDQDILYEIDEAIKRIEKGTYGICELTGKPIPKARLDAIPWARFTVEAQEQLEREGALRQRPRLRPLGMIEQHSVQESESEEPEPETE